MKKITTKYIFNHTIPIFLILVIFTGKVNAKILPPLNNHFSRTDSLPKDSAVIDSVKAIKKWKASNSYISGSVSWKNDDGDKKHYFDATFGTKLQGRLDEIDLRIEAHYVSKKDLPDDNEQNLRVNWYHTVYRKWYLTGQGRIERNQSTYEGLRFDYALLIGGFGLGYKAEIKDFGSSRISVLYNYLDLIIITGKASGHFKAPSIYLDNNYQLAEKVNLRNWTNIIFWARNDTGYEIETELEYAIWKNLALGFRNYLLINGPTLQHSRTSELKFYTKITF
jgi:hypothetical protein